MCRRGPGGSLRELCRGVGAGGRLRGLCRGVEARERRGALVGGGVGGPPWGDPETGGVEATGEFLYVVVLTMAGGH